MKHKDMNDECDEFVTHTSGVKPETANIAGFTEQGAEGFARVFAAIRLPNALKLRTRISR